MNLLSSLWEFSYLPNLMCRVDPGFEPPGYSNLEHSELKCQYLLSSESRSRSPFRGKNTISRFGNGAYDLALAMAFGLNQLIILKFSSQFHWVPLLAPSQCPRHFSLAQPLPMEFQLISVYLIPSPCQLLTHIAQRWFISEPISITILSIWP